MARAIAVGTPTTAATAFVRTSYLQQACWFMGISAAAFLIPLVFSSWLALPHDLYYLVYFTIVAALLGSYVRASRINPSGVVGPRWRLSIVVGLVSGVFVVWSVLGRMAATPRPAGAYFLFEILWRGVTYGVVDACLLTAFPGLIARELMERRLTGIARRVAYAALTLSLVTIITATYHAGYKDLQNIPGIVRPEIGNVVISLPMVASANPAGSILAHVSMHLAAVAHAYESPDRLPPRVIVDSGTRHGMSDGMAR
jgi:hypothetical protein